MYAVDGRDRVVAIEDLPQSSAGAPCPLVVQDDRGGVVVAYYVQVRDPGWTGRSPRSVDPSTSGDPAALVRFHGTGAVMFGPPNDEAFKGHPLASRGLSLYSAAEVMDSSWIRILERMDSVHPSHHPSAFAGLRHFVLAFHDSTFECVAEGYDFVVSRGPVDGLVSRMVGMLRGRGAAESVG